jgi:hypothetical protein
VFDVIVFRCFRSFDIIKVDVIGVDNFGFDNMEFDKIGLPPFRPVNKRPVGCIKEQAEGDIRSVSGLKNRLRIG